MYPGHAGVSGSIPSVASLEADTRFSVATPRRSSLEEETHYIVRLDEVNGVGHKDMYLCHAGGPRFNSRSFQP
jgi:hypothetical protein